MPSDTPSDFSLPDALKIPAGINPGDIFTVLAGLKLKKNKKACVVHVDGHDVAVSCDDEENQDDNTDASALDNMSYPDAAAKGFDNMKRGP